MAASDDHAIHVATNSEKPKASEASTMVKVVKRMNNGAQTSATIAAIAHGSVINANNQISKAAKDAASTKDEKSSNRETSLAFIMMVYVLVFLICHFPRLFLNLIELTTIRYVLYVYRC